MFKDYEIVFYSSYVNGIKTIYGFLYKKGKSKNIGDYIYETSSNTKIHTFNKIKYHIRNHIDKDKNTLKYINIIDILKTNFSNMIKIKNNTIYILQPDDFKWLRNRMINDYDIRLKLNDNNIITIEK